MNLRVVGAGLGRTGTLSLKAALEQLLGAPCYHMVEVFTHPQHIQAWHAAAGGQMPDWRELLKDYAATVDWPAAAFWQEISSAFPDAIVLLSSRDAESWWKSASNTIFPTTLNQPPSEWRSMADALFAARFTSKLQDRDACIAAYESHNQHVRASVPKHRLLEWHPGDGWEPLCRALELPIPSQPFPHTNSTEEFLARHSSS